MFMEHGMDEPNVPKVKGKSNEVLNRYVVEVGEKLEVNVVERFTMDCNHVSDHMDGDDQNRVEHQLRDERHDCNHAIVIKVVEAIESDAYEMEVRVVIFVFLDYDHESDVHASQKDIKSGQDYNRVQAFVDLTVPKVP